MATKRSIFKKLKHIRRLYFNTNVYLSLKESSIINISKIAVLKIVSGINYLISKRKQYNCCGLTEL
jgi:hypothetical protein